MPQRRELEVLFQASKLLLQELDGDGRVVRASHSHLTRLARDPAELTGTPLVDQVPESDHAALQRAWEICQRDGTADVTLHLHHVRGGRLRSQATLHRLDEHGAQILLVLLPLETDEYGLMQLIEDHVPGTLYVCRNDATWSMLFLSRSVERLTGWSTQAFLDGTIDFVRLYHPDDVAGIEAEVASALEEHRPFELHYRLRHTDDSWRHVTERGDAVRDPEGEIAFLIGHLLDVTEQVRRKREREALEMRLMHTQKLESLGLLASGVAHDFNNLLLVILGNLDLARNALAEDDPIAEMLDTATVAAETATGLAQQMLEFSGRRPPDPIDLELSTLVQATTRMIRSNRPDGVHVDVDMCAADLPIRGDTSQLQQVVMNLVINACDALGERGGCVWVRCRRVEVDDREVADLLLPADGLPLGDYAVVEVEDTGRGMSADHLARIFEPFFTTKSTGHGLGLASVLGIIKGHDGGLAVTSTLGQGTRFRVYLPLAGSSRSMPGDPAIDPEISAST